MSKLTYVMAALLGVSALSAEAQATYYQVEVSGVLQNPTEGDLGQFDGKPFVLTFKVSDQDTDSFPLVLEMGQYPDPGVRDAHINIGSGFYEADFDTPGIWTIFNFGPSEPHDHLNFGFVEDFPAGGLTIGISLFGPTTTVTSDLLPEVLEKLADPTSGFHEPALESGVGFTYFPDSIFARGDFVTSVSAFTIPDPVSVPEPSGLALFGMGLIGLLTAKRRWTS